MSEKRGNERQRAMLRIRNSLIPVYRQVFNAKTTPPQNIIDFVVNKLSAEDDGGVLASLYWELDETRERLKAICKL